MGDDDVPPALTREDAWGVTVMRRFDDGWCAALDRNTMRCSIYERRPFLCREYPEGGDDCLVERSKYYALALAPSSAASLPSGVLATSSGRKAMMNDVSISPA